MNRTVQIQNVGLVYFTDREVQEYESIPLVNPTPLQVSFYTHLSAFFSINKHLSPKEYWRLRQTPNIALDFLFLKSLQTVDVLIQDNVHEVMWNREISINVLAAILNFNDQNLVIVGVPQMPEMMSRKMLFTLWRMILQGILAWMMNVKVTL